uniref:Uncharacterized protein n=1 Tax=Anopheles epiroticus TaxID=199890 RepID=A0A182PWX7_9DIPT
MGSVWRILRRQVRSDRGPGQREHSEDCEPGWSVRRIRCGARIRTRSRIRLRIQQLPSSPRPCCEVRCFQPGSRPRRPPSRPSGQPEVDCGLNICFGT